MKNSVLIVADSGATKTEWKIACEEKVYSLYSKGINPVTMDAASILEIMENEVRPFVDEVCKGRCSGAAVHFYGAGCMDSLAPVMKDIIGKGLKRECDINVYSDLMGAARALYADNSGIACILGTGANSGLFDGKNICKRVPPLGYILGDEGSGAYLGKRLVADILKGLMPDDVTNDFFTTYNMTEADIIKKVYKENGANRFLASFTHFIAEHRNNEYIQKLLRDSFSEFFIRNIIPYKEKCKVGFVGSIAYVFEKELKETAQLYEIEIGSIIKTPAEKLFEYHKKIFGLTKN